jgi:hypothetical protein
MIVIVKRFGTYVSVENLDLSPGKFIIFWGSWFFLEEQSC